MSTIKVAELQIQNFRKFHDVTIPFGERITLVVGQNGTAKSTLLGMLAQPFSFGTRRGSTAGKPDMSRYTSNYHGMNLHEHIDLMGNLYMYEANQIFRLSREFDFGNRYEYRTVLSAPDGTLMNLPDNELVTISRHRRSEGEITGMRFVTGPGASHESGEGRFPFPVIYLGLDRLWPLAVAEECSFPSEPVEKDDRDWYVEQYSTVLCLDEHDNNAKFMDTSEKNRFITPESDKYDGESCSAGQDNISQILTAMLSFRSLKKALGPKYTGGMLLIDELDATLHAYAQEELLKLLRDASEELELQIVATTHSLWMLEIAYESYLKHDIRTLHLVNREGTIQLENFSSFSEVRDHLKVKSTPLQRTRRPKVSVLFEDEETKFLFHEICGASMRNYIREVYKGSMGAGYLKTLGDITPKVPALADVVMVLDGDMRSQFKSPPTNLVFLPGSHRPETMIYRHLYQMTDTDPFWKSCGPTYSRQEAILSKGGTSLSKGDEKKWVKNWFQNQSVYWGKQNKIAYSSWVQANKADCLLFAKEFAKRARQRYKGSIPRGITDKIYAKFR